MSCVNWAVPGETGVKKPSSWEAAGISRIGLESWSKSLDVYFLTDYQISHFTHHCSKLFFCCPWELTGLCAVPHVLGAVQCHCRAVWWTQASPFCQFLGENCSNFEGLGTLRLVLLYQVFQHRTWIHKGVKERKEVFQWLVCIHFLMLGIK